MESAGMPALPGRDCDLLEVSAASSNERVDYAIWFPAPAIPVFTERMQEANRMGGVMDGKAKELGEAFAMQIEQFEACGNLAKSRGFNWEAGTGGATVCRPGR